LIHTGEQVLSGTTLGEAPPAPPKASGGRHGVAELPIRRILVVSHQPFYADRGTPAVDSIEGPHAEVERHADVA
jgi:hypothetical protein